MPSQEKLAALRVPSDQEQLTALLAEQRVLLAIRPDGPMTTWTAWGLD